MECSIYLVSEFWSTWKALTYSWVCKIVYSIVWECSHKCIAVLNSAVQECFIDTICLMEMYYIWFHLHELLSFRVDFLVAHTSLLDLGPSWVSAQTTRKEHCFLSYRTNYLLTENVLNLTEEFAIMTQFWRYLLKMWDHIEMFLNHFDSPLS